MERHYFPRPATIAAASIDLFEKLFEKTFSVNKEKPNQSNESRVSQIFFRKRTYHPQIILRAQQTDTRTASQFDEMKGKTRRRQK